MRVNGSDVVTYPSKGRRVYPDERGGISFHPGDYGKTIQNEWLARPPQGHLGSLSDHEVEEHPDGTITVTPSIEGEGFHGHLTKGVWTIDV